MRNNMFQSEIEFKAHAVDDGGTIYQLEATYGGVFQVGPVPREALEPFLLVNGDIFTAYPFERLLSSKPKAGGAHLVLVPNPEHNDSGDFSLAGNRVVQPRERGLEYNLSHFGDHFYLITNLDATNFRLMKTPVDQTTKEHWTEVIPHRDDAMVREIQAFNDWLVVGERKDGLRKVRVLKLDGSVDRYLYAAAESYVMWPALNVSTDTSNVRYSYSSLITPNQTWEVDLETGDTVLLKAMRVLGDFDSDNYRTSRLAVTARDGTLVPLSIAYHKDTRRPLD